MITHIPASQELKELLKSTTWQITEDELEKVESGPDVDGYRLNKEPLKRYEQIIRQVINEAKQASPGLRIPYRASVVRLRSGPLVGEDERILIVPITKEPNPEQVKVVFYRDRSQHSLVDWYSGEQNLNMYLLERGVRFSALKGEIWFIAVVLSEKQPDGD